VKLEPQHIPKFALLPSNDVIPISAQFDSVMMWYLQHIDECLGAISSTQNQLIKIFPDEEISKIVSNSLKFKTKV
jgi:hypothetical protein